MPLLKQILDSLQSQQTSQEPDRPDVAIRPKPKRDRIYPFTQSYVGPNITAGLVEVDGAISFSLSSLQNVTSYTTIFDKYRIVQARVSFHPYVGLNTETTGVTSGPLITVIDYDDANVTTFAGLMSYDNKKIAPLGSFFERTLVPRFAVAAYSGVFTSFAQSAIGQWVDAASTGIQYYGLKYSLPVGLSVGILWTTTITLEIEFAHPR
jgi:hypothetical protein